MVSVKRRFGPGRCQIKVTAEGVSELPLVREIDIPQLPDQRLLDKLAGFDFLTHAVGFALVSLVAFVATEDKEAWGSLGDYVTLVSTAFGVGSGVQGLRSVLTLIRS
jgi:hypothetical protein